MALNLTAEQARVLGVLIEKSITTPDQYPLSTNAVMLGCNQKSSRDPVVEFTEGEVQRYLTQLDELGLVLTESGSRVHKYRQRLCNTEFSELKITGGAVAVLTMLLLRGPQTSGELRSRSGRLFSFSSLEQVEKALLELQDCSRQTLAKQLPRKPGKREIRWVQLLVESDLTEQALAYEPPAAATEPANPEAKDALSQKVEQLEQKVAELEQRLEQLEQLLE